jgi:hypothetical protein
MAKSKIVVVAPAAVIYNHSTKTKAQLRSESNDAMALFLASGGVIQQGRKPRARKGGKMASKTTRFVSGTSGFANGFPRKSTGAL